VRDVIELDSWIAAAVRKMQDEDGKYVLPDVRFPNEWVAVKRLGGATVRIERPGVGPVNGHLSEIALDSYSFDWLIVNDGTAADLRRSVYGLAQHLEETA
jgi:hypothetical protein